MPVQDLLHIAAQLSLCALSDRIKHVDHLQMCLDAGLLEHALTSLFLLLQDLAELACSLDFAID